MFPIIIKAIVGTISIKSDFMILISSKFISLIFKVSFVFQGFIYFQISDHAMSPIKRKKERYLLYNTQILPQIEQYN